MFFLGKSKKYTFMVDWMFTAAAAMLLILDGNSEQVAQMWIQKIFFKNHICEGKPQKKFFSWSDR